MKGAHRSRWRRRATAVGAAGSALLLAACTGTPGVAASVNGRDITANQVDDFARVLCSLGAAQSTTGGTPTRSVRFQAVQILVDDQLAADVGNVASADQKTVNSILSQMNTSRPSVPKSLQPTYDKVAEEFARAQAAVIALGRSELEKQGKSASSITDNAAYAEGQKVRTQFAKSAHITVDPRYGSVVDGQLQPGDGSLSVPVSSMAREGTPSVTQPNASLVSQLPASQKCSS